MFTYFIDKNHLNLLVHISSRVSIKEILLVLIEGISESTL